MCIPPVGVGGVANGYVNDSPFRDGNILYTGANVKNGGVAGKGGFANRRGGMGLQRRAAVWAWRRSSMDLGEAMEWWGWWCVVVMVVVVAWW